MTTIVGIDYEAGKALFQIRSLGVVVDINKRDVDRTCSIARALTASSWMKVAPDLQYPSVWRELAEAAVTELEVREKKAEAVTERKFRVPESVKAEAAQALDWASAFERGGSPVALAVAKQLRDETYVSFSKLQRISRYFARRPASVTENAGWEAGTEGFPADDRIKYSLWGGDSARSWIAKVAKTHALLASADGLAPDAEADSDVDPNQPHEYVDDSDIPGQCLICGREQEEEIHLAAVVAGAFEYDDGCEYFGRGVDPDTTIVDALFVLRPDETWAQREAGSWTDVDELSEDTILIMLDPESAQKLADIIDSEDSDVLPFELSSLNPREAALFYAAESELDYEMIDRVFDIYDSQERSVNAKKQVRGPGGKFGDDVDDPDSEKTEEAGETKARLPQSLPLVADVNQRIDRYLADVAKKRNADGPEDVEGEDSAEDGPMMAAGGPGEVTDVRPLYLAIVDSVDTEAVLDVISLVPPAAGTSGDVVAWRRDNSTWLPADELLAKLRSTSPPPVVEITDDALLQNVLDQVDKATADDSNPNQNEAPAPSTPEAPKPDANPDQHPITAGGHDLIFLENRRTPKVVPEGKKYEPKPSEGKVKKRRKATADEEKTIRNGEWVRVNEHGKTPKDSDYKSSKKSKIRPQNNSTLSRRGFALPDGTFAITDVTQLRSALAEFSSAKNESLARTHIIKRARALNRLDLLPESWDKSEKEPGYTMWGPQGEIIPLAAAGEGGADRNRGNAEELREYWERGEGAAKINWEAEGSWYRCVSLLSQYLGSRSKGYCALRYHAVKGRWPGDRDDNE